MASDLEVGHLLEPLPLPASRSNSPSTSPNELSVTPPALTPVLPTLPPPPVDDSRWDEVISQTWKELLADISAEVILDSHREFRIGLGFLQDVPELSSEGSGRKKFGDRLEVRPHRICTTPGLDIFGQSPSINGKLGRNLECWCPACNRQMAASRFAPHLEKCLGMGRNSFRQANRRLTTATTTANPLTTSTRAGSRSFAAEANIEMELDSDEEVVGGSGDEFHPGDLEEEEDEDWLSVRKRRPRRRPAQPLRKPSRKVAGEEEGDGYLLGSLIPDLFPDTRRQKELGNGKASGASGQSGSYISDNSRDGFEEFPTDKSSGSVSNDPFLLDS